MAAGNAYVLLEDGSRFDGLACGAPTYAVGEVVFTTGMSGYQESVSDPSFAGQLLTFTYPHIGNYGVSGEAMESQSIWAKAAIMRAACDFEDSPGAERGWLSWLADCGVPGISDVDTRALVRHIRQEGSMRGGLFPGEMDGARAMELIAAEPPMQGRDLARVVSPGEVSELAAARNGHGTGHGPLIAVLDTGVKSSIVRKLTERGARVRLHPCTSSPQELLEGDPDAVLLGNGPGDPAALDYVVETVRGVLGVKPVWGICLGHQMLCRALGLSTFKLPFGHRGANHPVKDLSTGRVEITSQNHGFAVLGPDGGELIDSDEPVRWETDFGAALLSHVNLYDRTVEGLTLLDVPGGSVQYHPEAGPGPHDSVHFFDRMLSSLA
ncbi:MAG TPA: glutamine-hydrolyzing carbamoyl-phosphate synthase small subunit [Solirubrobacteraceae bacterium]|jgi:carbamoyl-phosphate synthase small subunit|nr:glutamine-hydrolyzing carbamoyl-phosphate synthase small subunit [Solirubrobacteraceae bacterium]